MKNMSAAWAQRRLPVLILCCGVENSIQDLRTKFISVHESITPRPGSCLTGVIIAVPKTRRSNLGCGWGNGLPGRLARKASSGIDDRSSRL